MSQQNRNKTPGESLMTLSEIRVMTESALLERQTGANVTVEMP